VIRSRTSERASASAIRPGTSPERRIKKPVSPMFQVIRPSLSSSAAEMPWPIARPASSAVTIAAAAPSPNCAPISSGSRSTTSWWWSVDSSTVTTSTRARGSDRTMWRAVRKAVTAA
jgi:hypothetical protein